MPKQQQPLIKPTREEITDTTARLVGLDQQLAARKLELQTLVANIRGDIKNIERERAKCLELLDEADK